MALRVRDHAMRARRTTITSSHRDAFEVETRSIGVNHGLARFVRRET